MTGVCLFESDGICALHQDARDMQSILTVPWTRGKRFKLCSRPSSVPRDGDSLPTKIPHKVRGLQVLSVADTYQCEHCALLYTQKYIYKFMCL